MIQKMKKLTTAAVLAAFGLTFVPQFSHAEAANVAPSYAGGIRHQNESYMGVKAIRVASSASAQLLHVGAGFVDAVCPFLGTAGNYTMLFDALAADGASTLVTGPTSANSLTYALTPAVYTAGTAIASAGIYSLAQNYQGCWVPSSPIKFVNGLYSMANATGHVTIVYAHCADGTNPCVMP